MASGQSSRNVSFDKGCDWPCCGILRGHEATATSIHWARPRSKRRLAGSFMQIAKSLMMRTPPNQELFDELVSQDIDNLFPQSHPDSPSATARVSPGANDSQFIMTKTLVDMWDKWHGVGKFQDSLGGIKGRKERHKRKRQKCINSTFFCRIKQCVFGIEVHANANQLAINAALELLQQEHVNCRRLQCCQPLQKISRNWNANKEKSKRQNCTNKSMTFCPILSAFSCGFCRLSLRCKISSGSDTHFSFVNTPSSSSSPCMESFIGFSEDNQGSLCFCCLHPLWC